MKKLSKLNAAKLGVFVVVAMAVILVTLSNARFRADEAAPTTLPDYHELSEFGAAGLGGDDTAVIQAALNYPRTPGYRYTLHIPAGTYNVNPLFINTRDITVNFDSGATLSANTGYRNGVVLDGHVIYDKLLTIKYAENITLSGPGAVFKMRKSEYELEANPGSQRSALAIIGGKHISINGLTLRDSGGDGLQMSSDTDTNSRKTNEDIRIKNIIVDNNRRDGLTISNINGLTIKNSVFKNTSSVSYGHPSIGIALENSYQYEPLSNILLDGNVTENNSHYGLTLNTRALNNNSAPISVTIKNHRDLNSGAGGMVFLSEPDLCQPYEKAPCQAVTPVGGLVQMYDSVITNPFRYGLSLGDWKSNGPLFASSGLTIENPSQAVGTNIDSNALYVITKNGSFGKMGNIRIINSTISTNVPGTLACYFTIQDSGNTGYENIEITKGTGQWSGAVNNAGCLGFNNLVENINIWNQGTGAPVADFLVSATSGNAGLSVSFINTTTNTSPATTLWQWDFGDGSAFSGLQNPVHEYTAPGVYTVTLIASNENGTNSVIKSGYITVLGVTASPTAEVAPLASPTSTLTPTVTPSPTPTPTPAAAPVSSSSSSRKTTAKKVAVKGKKVVVKKAKVVKEKVVKKAKVVKEKVVKKAKAVKVKIKKIFKKK